MHAYTYSFLLYIHVLFRCLSVVVLVLVVIVAVLVVLCFLQSNPYRMVLACLARGRERRRDETSSERKTKRALYFDCPLTSKVRVDDE